MLRDLERLEKQNRDLSQWLDRMMDEVVRSNKALLKLMKVCPLVRYYHENPNYDCKKPPVLER